MPQLIPWRPGDPVLATRLNDIQTAIPGVIIGARGTAVKRVGNGVVVGQGGSPANAYRTVSQRFVVTELHDEYLVCHPYNAIMGKEEEIDYMVAKPVALRIITEGEGEDAETLGAEYYAVGDEIIAHIGILGQTGVETELIEAAGEDPEVPPEPVYWEVVNANGFGAPLLVELTADAEDGKVTVKRVNYDGTLGDTEYTVWELSE